MKIAIDFDGVICKRVGIPTVMETDDIPVEGALHAIELFLKMKYHIWVFTSNPNLKEVEKWLRENGFPELKVTNIKEPAHVYIDDRAVRFTNWQDIRKYFA